MTATPLRCVIVDDEALARRRLRRLLESEPDVVVAGECASVAEAVGVISEIDADVAFLDVQMPHGDGFQLIRTMAGKRATLAFVFVTAYSDYAVAAFEANAVDYLLKPIRVERLREAISRVRSSQQRHDAGEVLDRVSAALLKGSIESGRPADSPPGGAHGRLQVRVGEATHFLPPEEIIWVEGDGNNVKLHTARGVLSLRATLAWIEGSLPTRHFVRVHRSAIVQLRRVREMRPNFSGDATLVLDTGETLRLSRGYREQFLERMGGSKK